MSRVFISYSHKDKQHKELLLKFLSPLLGSCNVSIWSDEALDPGDLWHEQIQRKLQEHDKVVALVTPNFLASSYIQEHEIGPSIESNRHRVIPIVVEVCSWKRTPLGKLLALPEDGVPIEEWSSANAAWKQVAERLLDYLVKSEQVPTPAPAKEDTSRLDDCCINGSTSAWLNELDLPFSHPTGAQLRLSDVFVSPKVRATSEDSSDLNSARDALSSDLSPKKLIYGEEQSGKTALAKEIYKKHLSDMLIPVYLKGSEIRNKNFETWLWDAFNSQYDGPLEETLASGHMAVIIDDIDGCALNKSAMSNVLKYLAKNFSHVDILASDAFKYVSLDIEGFEYFREYEILPFGKRKRQELVEAWIAAGRQDHILEEELYMQADHLLDRLDSIVLKNVVPPLPPYILAILSLASSGSGKDMELSAHGHCYQYLVYQALEKSNIAPRDLDKFMNLLTQLAGWIYEGGVLNNDGLSNFFDEYNKIYLPVKSDNPISILQKCLLLEEDIDGWRFKHPYVYYFFAAKWISENLSSEKFRTEVIARLLGNLHKQDCANILIFVVHHCNSMDVLDEVEYALLEQFSEYSMAWLERGELDFIEQFLDEIPEVVMEKREVSEARRRHAELEEKAERRSRDIDQYVDGLDPSDLLAQVTKVLKSLELVGQVVRGRAASVPKDKLTELIKESQFAGLRFLRFFLGMSEVGREEVIRSVEEVLSDHPDLTNREVEVEAKKAYLFMTYGVIFGVLHKIAVSVGSSDASVLYDEIESEYPKPSIRLIRYAIELQHEKHVDVDKVRKLASDFENNGPCLRILKELLVQHVYMFPVGYKKKQQLAEILKIPLEYQYRSQLVSGGKREKKGG